MKAENMEKKKNKNFFSYEKFKNSKSKTKFISYQTSPQTNKIHNQDKINNKKFKYNSKLNSNLNIITKSNYNTNSVKNKSNLHKNKTFLKYNIINSHLQSSIKNNSYVNINKKGNNLKMNKSHKSKELKELNNSNNQNNISQSTEHNNINSYYETNNSSSNIKKGNNLFSLNKKNKNKFNSQNISLSNTVCYSKGKNNALLYHDKTQHKILFHEFNRNSSKNSNKKLNIKNETYNKSNNLQNISLNNFSTNNSINKSNKSKTKISSFLNESNLTTYNKLNSSIIKKNSNIIKSNINKISQNKKPLRINNIYNANKNYKIFNNEYSLKAQNFSKDSLAINNTTNKEKIDVQITSINNLLNSKFIKEINNIQSEMEKNLKLNKINSKSKKYNILKHFFEKFLKKLNEYLNKNTFNCLNFFLQKIMNGYHEIVISFYTDIKNIKALNKKVNQDFEDLQKILKQSEKKIILLQEQNRELLDQIKIKKNSSNDNIDYINFLQTQYSSICKKSVNVEEMNHNFKIFNLNKKNLDDLDSLYFFDKINMKNQRTLSRKIPLLPIKNNTEDKIKKNSSKKNDLNNNFLKIKQAFE